MTGSCGASIALGLRMGNSICASRVTHLSFVASTAITDLVLFHLIGGDGHISSFDLLIFLCGAGTSRIAADVQGICYVSTFSCSSTVVGMGCCFTKVRTMNL